MENLLRWSLANSDPRDVNQPPPAPRSDLNPEIIDAILGKPDSELMKEALAVAVDEKRDEDERIQALDDFEMLIEQIDNANNLEKLKMWEPLHSLLTNPTSSEEIQMQTLWILGTAVQNNPAAQNAYLAHNPLRALLSFLSPTVRSGKTRSKAVYALSGLLKHNAAAVRQMQEVDGWDALRDALQDSDITVRRKVAFLLNSLLIPTAPPQTASQSPPAPPVNIQQPLQVPTSTAAVVAASDQLQSLSIQPSSESPVSAPPSTSTAVALSSATSSDAQARSESQSAPGVSPPQTVHPNSHASMVADPSSYSTSPTTARALEEKGILQTLISSLASPIPHGPNGETEGDADFEEKVLRALHTYTVGCKRPIEGEDRKTLGEWLGAQSESSGGDAKVAEKWNLTEDEVKELRQAIA
ncbi:nucleotide exchange factors-like protein [Earliella scabrosa]|nr:nucleotide exchange factors-like protein [Earliella scabrosa]